MTRKQTLARILAKAKALSSGHVGMGDPTYEIARMIEDLAQVLIDDELPWAELGETK